MDEDVKILVSKMKDDKRQRIVKVYGMGGLGKTTLATMVYNHTDLQSYARVWVCLTQRFESVRVLRKILSQLDSNAKIEDMDVQSLRTNIHSLLSKMKCVIVIDDIWEDAHWESIRRAIPVNCNCNVILTTRYENIANQQSEPHKLGILNNARGWELLKKVADFPRVDAYVESFEKIGREIVSKCGGLPLSICVIGGILRQKEHTLLGWREVNENIGSKLMHGDGVKEEERVKQVLELSYDALPYHLKPCFLYLACLSEDEEIDAKRLYLLWMAEGFIPYQEKKPNESLIDVAQRYQTELSHRCMVQLHKSETCTPLQDFDRCGLHDLMHDLCSLKAEEENFMRRIDAFRYLANNPSEHSHKRMIALPPSIGHSIRRLAINSDGCHYVSSISGLDKLKDVTSFVLLHKGNSRDTKIVVKENMIDFEMSKCLRIFVVEGCYFERGMLPNVSELIHLRYLSLRSCGVSELPKFVCSLPYMQTLDLRVTTWPSLRLPNLIWKMKRLKHLFLPWNIQVIEGEKLRLDGLDELETLDEIRSETACIADIPKLVSLRTMSVKVCDLDSMSIVVSNISRLRNTSLVVEKCDFSSEEGRVVLNDGLMSPSLVTLKMVKCNMSSSFPCYREGMCESLVYLELHRSNFKVDIMEFGKYPMLQTLSLFKVEVTETLVCHSDSFPQLKRLNLKTLHDIKKWEVKKGAMPKLTNLLIGKCHNLEKVPDGLRFIPTLRRMTFVFMPREFVEGVKEEDYAPSVEIQSH